MYLNLLINVFSGMPLHVKVKHEMYLNHVTEKMNREATGLTLT